MRELLLEAITGNIIDHSFADDVAKIADDLSKAKEALTRFERIGKERWGLQINPEKTEYIQIWGDSHQEPKKFLGVLIDANLTMEPELKNRTEKFKKLIYETTANIQTYNAIEAKNEDEKISDEEGYIIKDAIAGSVLKYVVKCIEWTDAQKEQIDNLCATSGIPHVFREPDDIQMAEIREANNHKKRPNQKAWKRRKKLPVSEEEKERRRILIERQKIENRTGCEEPGCIRKDHLWGKPGNKNNHAKVMHNRIIHAKEKIHCTKCDIDFKTCVFYVHRCEETG